MVLNFKATAEMNWLEQALGLNTRWWMKNKARVKVVQEILEAIEEGKSAKKGAGSNARLVVAIVVRGQALRVVNDARSPSLAFDTEAPVWHPLEWRG